MLLSAGFAEQYGRGRALIACVKRLIFLAGVCLTLTFTLSALAEVPWQLSVSSDLNYAAGLRHALEIEMRELSLVNREEYGLAVGKKPEIFIAARELEQNATQVLELRVWERGISVGTRRVALSGGSRLVTRRAALAVSELVRNLNQRRKRELRLEAQAEEAAEALRVVALAAEKSKQLQLVARTEATSYTRGGWSVGPVLGVSILRHVPVQIDLAFSWQAGRLTQLREASLGQTAPNLTIIEARFGLGWNFYESGPWRASSSLKMTYSVASMGSGVMTDATDSPSSWTSRASGEVSLSYAWQPALRTELSFFGGGLLRPIELSLNGVNESLSGGLVGGAVSLYFGL